MQGIGILAQTAAGARAVLDRVGGWAEAPEYVELFAPPAGRTAYRAFVSPRPLAEALSSIMDEPSLLHPPGAWRPRSLAARDAFGESGPYNRWDLTRLYVSRTVAVARGPRGSGSRADESWMLFSPYPDRTMSALQPGTLLLVVQVPPL